MADWKQDECGALQYHDFHSADEMSARRLCDRAATKGRAALLLRARSSGTVAQSDTESDQQTAFGWCTIFTAICEAFYRTQIVLRLLEDQERHVSCFTFHHEDPRRVDDAARSVETVEKHREDVYEPDENRDADTAPSASQQSNDKPNSPNETPPAALMTSTFSPLQPLGEYEDSGRSAQIEKLAQTVGQSRSGCGRPRWVILVAHINRYAQRAVHIDTTDVSSIRALMEKVRDSYWSSMICRLCSYKRIKRVSVQRVSALSFLAE